MRWLLLVCLCLSAGPVWAGAWAREAGTTFLSLKGGAAFDGAVDPATFALYAERGWSYRLTLGAKYDRLAPTLDAAEAFARWHLSAPDATWQFALEGGFGMTVDRAMESAESWADRTTAIAALHSGRGIPTPFGAGWVDSRLAALVPLNDDPTLFKIDVTAGVALEGGHLAMVELRGSFGDGRETLLHIGPTAAVKLGRTHLTAGIFADPAGEAPARAELGAWIEF